jgi:hypothetical protein
VWIACSFRNCVVFGVRLGDCFRQQDTDVYRVESFDEIANRGGHLTGR